MLCAKTKDEKNRLCVDWRELNIHEVFDSWMLGDIARIPSVLKGKMMYFTKLNLARGFYQVPITEVD